MLYNLFLFKEKLREEEKVFRFLPKWHPRRKPTVLPLCLLLITTRTILYYRKRTPVSIEVLMQPNVVS